MKDQYYGRFKVEDRVRCRNPNLCAGTVTGTITHVNGNQIVVKFDRPVLGLVEYRTFWGEEREYIQPLSVLEDMAEATSDE